MLEKNLKNEECSNLPKKNNKNLLSPTVSVLSVSDHSFSSRFHSHRYFSHSSRIINTCSACSHFRHLFSKLVAFLLATFSMFSGSFLLFLSAVLEASRCFRRPSWKLLAAFVGCLGCFSLFLSTVLEASRCFCRPS